MMNTWKPDEFERALHDQLGKRLLDGERRLQDDLAERLDTIGDPAVQAFARQLADQTVARYRGFSSALLLRSLVTRPPIAEVPIETVIEAGDQVRRRPRWTRLLRRRPRRARRRLRR